MKWNDCYVEIRKHDDVMRLRLENIAYVFMARKRFQMKLNVKRKKKRDVKVEKKRSLVILILFPSPGA